MHSSLKVLLQVAGLVVAAGVLAAGTVWIKGEPNRELGAPKEPEKMVLTEEEKKMGYVLISTVLKDWKGDVLWVDARARRDWEANGVEGSVLITEDRREDKNTLIGDAFPKIAEAEENGRKMVIYCAQSGCSDSKTIARALREEGVFTAENIFILKGGVFVIPKDIRRAK